MTLCAGVLVYLIVISTLQKGEKEEERRERTLEEDRTLHVHTTSGYNLQLNLTGCALSPKK